jgi:hypothetical protein
VSIDHLAKNLQQAENESTAAISRYYRQQAEAHGPRRCIKCGATDHWTRWYPAYEYRQEWECKQRNRTEHLCRGCRNCGFTWDEPVLAKA